MNVMLSFCLIRPYYRKLLTEARRLLISEQLLIIKGRCSHRLHVCHFYPFLSWMNESREAVRFNRRDIDTKWTYSRCNWAWIFHGSWRFRRGIGLLHQRWNSTLQKNESLLPEKERSKTGKGLRCCVKIRFPHRHVPPLTTRTIRGFKIDRSADHDQVFTLLLRWDQTSQDTFHGSCGCFCFRQKLFFTSLLLFTLLLFQKWQSGVLG